METIYERVAALDVHKAQVTACVRVPEQAGRREPHLAEFSTMVAGLVALRDWLAAYRVTHVAMEATGVFWQPVWHVLEDDFELTLCNARHVKQVPGRKTDVSDAQWLCQLMEAGLLRGSFVPPKPQRQLRTLTRYRKTHDATLEIARRLAGSLERVIAVHLDEKGRGRALRATWLASDADIVAYMDVDLSTDLHALSPLPAALASGHSQVAIGTRLAGRGRMPRVTRGTKRELISRTYNHILRLALGARFSDAQCGFKALRADAARALLPDVADQGWFFDTELLIAAQRRGMRIHEVAVDWVDDSDSRVDILPTALADLRGVLRLRFDSPLPRFLAIGLASTLAYAALYLLLRALGTGSVLANAIALAVTAVANTQANRMWAFSIRGREGFWRQHGAGALVYLLALGLTDGALAVLKGLVGRPSRLLEVAVLVLASLVATACRYVALRTWVFARGRRAERAAPLRSA